MSPARQAGDFCLVSWSSLPRRLANVTATYLADEPCPTGRSSLPDRLVILTRQAGLPYPGRLVMLTWHAGNPYLAGLPTSLPLAWMVNPARQTGHLFLIDWLTFPGLARLSSLVWKLINISWQAGQPYLGS
jgi:hypothetical protein